MAKDQPKQISTTKMFRFSFLDKIAHWQQQLNQEMARLVREARETGSLRPLFILIILAFIYGVLHSAGPGHGKVVTTSYLLTTGKKIRQGILLGNLVAFFHGLSGVVLVMTVHFILNKAIMSSLQSVTRVTQIISYSLIMLVGALLLFKNILSLRQRPNDNDTLGRPFPSTPLKHPLTIAAAVGMIPCPGIILVMLFCVSLNQIGLGLILAFFIMIGMAMTISVVGVVGVTGKNLALGAMERRPGIAKFLGRTIEMGSASIILLLGMLFLAAIL
ncbi:MAG: hypothetical protein JW932_08060 [Deltaproteobacteria bacterium]|nr:hypothetical protein [Deltaproteobacteria bacterium]